MSLLDRHGRPLRNLRLSVTDRCNLRCAYCMPEESYQWLPRKDLLSFEELAVLVRAFVELGVTRLRLTGGEPLLRRNLPALVRQLASVPQLEDLAITTNGLLLADQARTLVEAGMGRFSISLDSLRPERVRELTRRDGLADTLRGIETLQAIVGKHGGTKIDTVVMRGTNDDELEDLLSYARDVGAELRFIEYMDVGGATRWSMDKVVSRAEMLERLARSFGAVEAAPDADDPRAPADRYRLPDGTLFGIISSTTQPFCGECDRSRVTADGMWFLCLYARGGHDLRSMLRGGATHEALVDFLREVWTGRSHRGAEERLAQEMRVAPPAGEDPHVEMHTRGG
ncbi:MAG: GTP 3',8-cyclase MoaA [Planctomycetes bacterium]|nr:GTP 3',8-cyclase MoaA [Planctomycetota bacterium]MCB9905510.1 GTP 3',8-cyclase MoaA [Planctomycetota bacterium]